MNNRRNKRKVSSAVLSTAIMGIGVVVGTNFVLKYNSDEIRQQTIANKENVKQRQLEAEQNGESYNYGDSKVTVDVDYREDLKTFDLNQATLLPEQEGMMNWVQYSSNSSKMKGASGYENKAFFTMGGTFHEPGAFDRIVPYADMQWNAWINFRIITEDKYGNALPADQIKYGLGIVFDAPYVEYGDINTTNASIGARYGGGTYADFLSNSFRSGVLPSDNPKYVPTNDPFKSGYQILFLNYAGFTYDEDDNLLWNNVWPGPDGLYGDSESPNGADVYGTQFTGDPGGTITLQKDDVFNPFNGDNKGSWPGDNGYGADAGSPYYGWKSVRNQTSANSNHNLTFEGGFINEKEDWPFTNSSEELFGLSWRKYNHFYAEFDAREGATKTSTTTTSNTGYEDKDGLYRPGLFEYMGTDDQFFLSHFRMDDLAAKNLVDTPIVFYPNFVPLDDYSVENMLDRDKFIYLGYPNPELKLDYKGFKGPDFVVDLGFDNSHIDSDFTNIHGMTYEFYGPDSKTWTFDENAENYGLTLWDEIQITDDPNTPIRRQVRYLDESGNLGPVQDETTSASQWAKANGWSDGEYNDISNPTGIEYDPLDESTFLLNSAADKRGAAWNAEVPEDLKNGDMNIATDEKVTAQLKYPNVFYLDSATHTEGEVNYIIKINTYATASNVGQRNGYLSLPIKDIPIEFPILSEAQVPLITASEVDKPTYNEDTGAVSITVNSMTVDIKTAIEDNGIDTVATSLYKIEARAIPTRYGDPTTKQDVWVNDDLTYNVVESTFENQTSGDGIITIDPFTITEANGLRPNNTYKIELIYTFGVRSDKAVVDPSDPTTYTHFQQEESLEIGSGLPGESTSLIFTTPSRGESIFETTGVVTPTTFETNYDDETITTSLYIPLSKAMPSGAPAGANVTEYQDPEINKVTVSHSNGYFKEFTDVSWEQTSQNDGAIKFNLEGLTPNTDYSGMEVTIDYGSASQDPIVTTIDSTPGTFVTPSLGFKTPVIEEISDITLATNASQQISASGNFTIGNVTDGTDGYEASALNMSVTAKRVDNGLAIDPSKIVVTPSAIVDGKQTFEYVVNDLDAATDYKFDASGTYGTDVPSWPGYPQPIDVPLGTVNTGTRGEMNISTGAWGDFVITTPIAYDETLGTSQVTISYSFVPNLNGYAYSEFTELTVPDLSLSLVNQKSDTEYETVAIDRSKYEGSMVITPDTTDLTKVTIAGEVTLDTELLGLTPKDSGTQYVMGLALDYTTSSSDSLVAATPKWFNLDTQDVVNGIGAPTLSNVANTTISAADPVEFTRNLTYTFDLIPPGVVGNTADSVITNVEVFATKEGETTSESMGVLTPSGNTYTFDHTGADARATYNYSADVTYEGSAGVTAGLLSTTETYDLGSFMVPGAGVDPINENDVKITSASADNKSITFSYVISNDDITPSQDPWEITSVDIVDSLDNVVESDVNGANGFVTFTGIKPGTQLTDIASAGYKLRFNAFCANGSETSPGIFADYTGNVDVLIDSNLFDPSATDPIVDGDGNLIGSPDTDGEFTDLDPGFADALPEGSAVVNKLTDTIAEITVNFDYRYADLVDYTTISAVGTLRGITLSIPVEGNETDGVTILVEGLEKGTDYNLNQISITYNDIYGDSHTNALEDSVITTLDFENNAIDPVKTFENGLSTNSVVFGVEFEPEYAPLIQNIISINHGAASLAFTDTWTQGATAFDITIEGLDADTTYNMNEFTITYADVYGVEHTNVLGASEFTTLPDFDGAFDVDSTKQVDSSKTSITLEMSFNAAFVDYIDMNTLTFTYGSTRGEINNFNVEGEAASFTVTFDGLKKKSTFDLSQLSMTYADTAGVQHNVIGVGIGEASTDKGFPWWILIIILLVVITLGAFLVWFLLFRNKDEKEEKEEKPAADKDSKAKKAKEEKPAKEIKAKEEKPAAKKKTTGKATIMMDEKPAEKKTSTAAKKSTSTTAKKKTSTTAKKTTTKK